MSFRHFVDKCPVPSNDKVNGGFWTYEPPSTKPRNSSVQPNGPIEAAHDASLSLEPKSDVKQDSVYTVTGIDQKVGKSWLGYITLTDQDGNLCLVPLQAMRITAELAKNGRVKISGEAPLNNSIYPNQDFKKH